MARVALQYGIFGGPLRAKRFAQALTKAGHTLEPNAAQAEVVICHSAGCFWLPEPSTKKQFFILIDPPYWPGKTITERARDRARSHLQYATFGYPFRHWLHRTAISAYYAVIDASRTRRIRKFAPSYDLTEVVKDRRGILVRNEHDDWLTPNLQDFSKENPNFKVVQMPGDHDDCWFDPKPYIELLKTIA